MGYRQGNEPLAGMAYFCLSFLEYLMREPGASKKQRMNNSAKRKKAANEYKIDISVLNKIGDLSSEKGGQEARKADGVDNSFTNDERTFLKQAIKKIIQRTAEKAHSPDNDLPEITLSDLPPI